MNIKGKITVWITKIFLVKILKFKKMFRFCFIHSDNHFVITINFLKYKCMIYGLKQTYLYQQKVI